jgi:hypothetical protein
MTLLFVTILLLIFAGLVALHFYSRLRRLKAVAATTSFAALSASTRYQPMLRLFSAEDEALVARNQILARKLKKQRTAIFREYLSCLSADYGRLLAGVRAAMVTSGVDRPDLAAALAKNQALFALALCRIEYRLFLHGMGLASVDVSGLVEAITALRSQVSVFIPQPVAAR